MNLTDAQPGQKVIYQPTDCRIACTVSLVGRTATVVRTGKSRVTIRWDSDGSNYDADPGNLKAAPLGEAGNDNRGGAAARHHRGA